MRGEEWTRTICDPLDPANRCPDQDCRCVPDGLTLVFEESGEPLLTYEEFVAGRAVRAMVVTETMTDGIQGWSYGVAHDAEDLEFLSATYEGTDIESIFQCELCPPLGFGVESCGDDVPCAPGNRTPGGGWVSAVILSLTRPVDLPVRRNIVARAAYGLLREVGEEGTWIRFTDRLAVRDAPPVDTNVTVDGRSRRWSTVTDGLLRRSPPGGARFRRGDADWDGRLSVTDAVRIVLATAGRLVGQASCEKAFDADDDGRLTISDALRVLQFLLQHGAPPPAPFASCQSDPTDDGLGCAAPPCG